MNHRNSISPTGLLSEEDIVKDQSYIGDSKIPPPDNFVSEVLTDFFKKQREKEADYHNKPFTFLDKNIIPVPQSSNENATQNTFYQKPGSYEQTTYSLQMCPVVHSDRQSLSHTGTNGNDYPVVNVSPTLVSPQEYIIHEAFQTLFPQYRPKHILNSGTFINLLSALREMFSECSFDDIKNYTARLKNHVGVYPEIPDKDPCRPWIDLEAARVLKLHEVLLWSPSSTYTPPKLPPLAPQIRTPLENGQYVPLEHVLHGLVAALFLPDPDGKNNYLIKLTDKLPSPFLSKIKKSDVIRGATVHSLFLGIKFPIFASALPGLIEDLWHFMFKNKYSACAGIELYNEVFYQFSIDLGLCKIRSLDQVSPDIIKKVSENWKNGRTI